MIKLVLPDIKYKASYIEAVKEFQTENNPAASNYLKLNIDELETNFDRYLQRLADKKDPDKVKLGVVPSTEFWIINDKNEYIGRVDIRHKLNDYLIHYGGHIGYNVRMSQRGNGYGTQALTLGLQKAKNLGLKKVLLTCNDDNIASAKIIEKHGGELEDYRTTAEGIIKRRYWITLT